MFLLLLPLLLLLLLLLVLLLLVLLSVLLLAHIANAAVKGCHCSCQGCSQVCPGEGVGRWGEQGRTLLLGWPCRLGHL